MHTYMILGTCTYMYTCINNTFYFSQVIGQAECWTLSALQHTTQSQYHGSNCPCTAWIPHSCMSCSTASNQAEGRKHPMRKRWLKLPSASMISLVSSLTQGLGCRWEQDVYSVELLGYDHLLLHVQQVSEADYCMYIYNLHGSFWIQAKCLSGNPN